MPLGDKYMALTQYLQAQHAAGNQKVELSFQDVEDILGFPLIATMRKYRWENDRAQSYAMSWMRAGYLVQNHTVGLERAVFVYDKEGADVRMAGPDASDIRRRNKTALQPQIPIATPTGEEIAQYLLRWQSNEQYTAQERALEKLFHEMAPGNDTIEEVILKVTVLNKFYATNIMSVYPVAKHIQSLEIQERLGNGDLTLVEDIATVDHGGKSIRHYSFATKYCSHHVPERFPIYDAYIQKMLCYFQQRDNFCSFSSAALQDYQTFYAVLTAFQTYYGLRSFGLKELDMYLWQLGKEAFPIAY